MIISRSDAYIGVLIDDITLKGTNEPYRMLTSRAEYRLLLRNDNVDERLCEYAFKNKMISKEEYQKIKDKYKFINDTIASLKKEFVSSNSFVAKKYGLEHGISKLKFLSNPEVDPVDILGKDFPYITELTIQVRLFGYLQKQKSMAEKMNRLEKLKLPENLNYSEVENLATEAIEKLNKLKPLNIGQASRISGINPADIQMLIYWMNHKRNK